jgi:ABC-type multidrug transport system fused ATPase/permease subunit
LVKRFRTPNVSNKGYLAHIFKCIRLLSPRAKFIYFVLAVVQVFLSVLDLVGLALVMTVVVAIQESGVSSAAPSNPPSFFLGSVFSVLSPTALLCLTVLIFVLKSAAALFLHSLIVKLMASESLRLVRVLNKAVFENRTNLYRGLSNQDISFSIYNATDLVFRDTLVPVSIISADLFLLILVGSSLFYSAEIVFFPTVIYFFTVFIILRIMERRSFRKAVREQMNQEILGRRLIHEASSSLRELYVSGKLSWMTDKIYEARFRGIRSGAIIAIAMLRPKYFYEAALFGGVGVIALVSWASGNIASSFTYLPLFLIASSRMIPGLLRIQFYLGTFHRSLEQTEKIFEILQTAPLSIEESFTERVGVSLHNNARIMAPEIVIESVSFAYGESSGQPTIDRLSLKVPFGEMLAIVGPSGAGKSTLLDLLLGFQNPSHGKILIAKHEPRSSFHRWPGMVAYVPQKITIYAGSLLSNIVIGNGEEYDQNTRERAMQLLKDVGLGEFVRNLDSGLDSELSELGTSLSGGQIQRIGIARALFTDPSLLVFDESTSSLDSVSENEIMRFLIGFKGKKTLIFVAHRLSTIKTADRILYLNGGKIEAEGSFEALQNLVPEFKNQVNLLSVEGS